MDEYTKLSTKDRLFVEEYLTDRNGPRAAAVVGYKNSNDAMRKPNVRAAVERGFQRQFNALRISAEDIAREAWKIAIDMEAPPASRVSALTLLAKRHVEFSEKHEITGEMVLRSNALVAIANMSANELKELAQNARQQLT